MAFSSLIMAQPCSLSLPMSPPSVPTSKVKHANNIRDSFHSPSPITATQVKHGTIHVPSSLSTSACLSSLKNLKLGVSAKPWLGLPSQLGCCALPRAHGRYTRRSTVQTARAVHSRAEGETDGTVHVGADERQYSGATQDSAGAPGAIRTSVQYIKRMDEKLWMDMTANKTNMQFEDAAITVHDARPLAHQLSLDKEGFELHPLHSKVTSWGNIDEVISVYFPEVAELVKRATGAKHVQVMSIARRSADVSEQGVNRGSQLGVKGLDPYKPGTGYQSPGVFAHSDYTFLSASQALQKFLGPNATEETVGRFGVVNVWKPLVDNVFDSPLGFVEASSLDPSALSLCQLSFPDTEAESWMLHSGPHQWYYFPRQRSDEAALFKQYDSDPSKARLCPHSSFQDPKCPSKGEYLPRKSIEVRLLVLYE